eukprot:scaffold33768_cov112-Isochrysis_galbana.AAC.8
MVRAVSGWLLAANRIIIKIIKILSRIERGTHLPQLMSRRRPSRRRLCHRRLRPCRGFPAPPLQPPTYHRAALGGWVGPQDPSQDLVQ